MPLPPAFVAQTSRLPATLRLFGPVFPGHAVAARLCSADVAPLSDSAAFRLRLL